MAPALDRGDLRSQAKILLLTKSHHFQGFSGKLFAKLAPAFARVDLSNPSSEKGGVAPC